MREKIVLVAVALLVVASISPVMAGPPQKGLGQGWKQYVTIKVDWDGNPLHQGDWLVYAGPYYVELRGGSVGDFITGCHGVSGDCLDMSTYVFLFVGNTLQFDETYVPGVIAYPQTHHVVLHSVGNGLYTGSVTARYDYPGSLAGVTRMDVIQYTVVTSGGAVTSFHYDEIEYIQPNA